jgi:small subunit ribosomal protein S1
MTEESTPNTVADPRDAQEYAALRTAPPPEPAADWLGDHDAVQVAHQGDVLDGIIVSVNPDGVLVDIHGKSEGLIDPRELASMSPQDRDQLTVGAKVLVYVVTTRDREHNLILSLEQAREEVDWRRAEALMQSRQALESTIVGYNRGGLLVELGKLRGFVPSSQLESARQGPGGAATPSERWSPLIGKPIWFKVIEVDREQNRLIFSERAAVRERRARDRAQLLDDLHEGQIRTGRVSNLADFGAFVDLGGLDGLVHVSELSWRPISHPKEVVSVGDEVQVYVLSVDPDQERIGLSIKRLDEDPWLAVAEQLPVGKLIEATITNLTAFGAFARPIAMAEVEGLIHISEVSEERITHPGDVLKKGQLVTARVIGVDTQRRRLSLSIRKVASDEYLESDWLEASTTDGEDVFDDLDLDDDWEEDR